MLTRKTRDARFITVISMLYHFTVTYDGINDNIDTAEDYDKADALWYDERKRCDVLTVEACDIYDAYEEALEKSEHLLSIETVEVYEDGRWIEWHAREEAVRKAYQGVAFSNFKKLEA